MKANELRIGNLIKGTANKNISEPKEFAVYAETFCDIESGYGVFEPIPLTEEWLIKFGLVKKNLTEGILNDFQPPDVDESGSIWYHWVHGVFNLEVQSNGEFWFEVYAHYIHVKYVHQLQNLYFALTGEELIYET